MTDTENLPAIPENWCWTTIGEISKIIHYGFTASSEKENIGPKMLRITDIQNNYVNWNNVPYCKIDPEQKEKYLLKAGDLVFARTGATVGKSYLIKGKIPESVFASYLIRIILSSKINNEYVYSFFQSTGYWSQIREGQVGIGQPNVNSKVLSQINVSLPPLSEQHRIVQRIEELFTDLDAGVKELEKAKVQVKNYRRAVLKAAFEGKLTEDWREKNSNLESMDIVLSQIIKTVKEGTLEEGKRKAKYKTPTKVNTQNLPKIPKTWIWVSIEQISSIVTDGDHNPPKRISSGVPHLTARNIFDYKITEENCTFISKDDFEKVRKRYDPQSGDIVLTCVGTIGRTAIVPENYVFSADRNLAVIRLIDNEIDPKFVQFFLNNPQAQTDMKNASGSTAQPHLYLKEIRAFPITLAPFEEQKVIVSEIERRFSVIDQIEKTIDQSLAQAEKLRQSILKKAFEGKLVPQDPNDEPASVLLERIKQEKGRAESRKKPGKRRKVKAETKMEVSGKIKQAELF